MNKPLLAFAGLIAAAGTAAGVYVALPGGGEEEVVRQLPTPTPEVGATVVATQAPTPVVTPVPSSPAIPDDWQGYVDPGGLFTIQYPPTWFQSTGQSQFSSVDLSTLTSTRRPDEALVVEVVHYEAIGSSGCGGALSVDSKSGEGVPEPGATAATLGELPAWQIVRVEGDSAIEGNLTRIQSISVIYKGYCFLVAAYFTQTNPDIASFLQIASTFQFRF